MVFIAPSMPRTTLAMLPVTCFIVTAVCTLLATASILDDNLRRFNRSFCFLIAFPAYSLAISALPCWIAFLIFAFSDVSSLPAFTACRLSCLAVNYWVIPNIWEQEIIKICSQITGLCFFFFFFFPLQFSLFICICRSLLLLWPPI